jgi:drug/metabolite transporter superfamily protein YnfA
METDKHGPKFWLGNGLLALALLVLFFLGALSEILGVWAMAVWMALAGLGMYFVMADGKGKSGVPD